MSDASYSSRRSVGPGGYHSRGQRHAGPPSVDAPTSISDAQTMLHDLYHSMQRQHQQPAGLSPAVRDPPFSPPMPSTAPPTTPAPPTEFPAHVRSRLAAAFERSVGHAPNTADHRGGGGTGEDRRGDDTAGRRRHTSGHSSSAVGGFGSSRASRHHVEPPPPLRAQPPPLYPYPPAYLPESNPPYYYPPPMPPPIPPPMYTPPPQYSGGPSGPSWPVSPPPGSPERWSHAPVAHAAPHPLHDLSAPVASSAQSRRGMMYSSLALGLEPARLQELLRNEEEARLASIVGAWLRNVLRAWRELAQECVVASHHSIHAAGERAPHAHALSGASSHSSPALSPALSSHHAHTCSCCCCCSSSSLSPGRPMQIEWNAMGACHSARAARLAGHDAGAEAVGRYEGPRDSDVRPLAAAPLAARGTLAR